MKRRDFIALAGAAAAFPRVAFGQQSTIKRMGFLTNLAQPDPTNKQRFDAFWEGAGKYGWDDRNLLGDYRFDASSSDAASKPAADLVAAKPDLLVAGLTPPLTALAKLTKSIPIVFAYVSPVTLTGLLGIANFGSPGGNITGIATMQEDETRAKSVELLRELLPSVRKFAAIYNPDAVPGGEKVFLDSYQALAAQSGLNFVPIAVRTPTELAEAIRSAATDPAQGVLMGDGYIAANRALAIAEAAKYRLVVIWGATQAYTDDGGLVSYAPDPTPIWRGAGEYSGLVLNGAKPGDLPIQTSAMQVTVNLKTAKTLGIAIPISVLARADRVIE